MTPLLFHTNYGGVPLDQISRVRVSPSLNLKLNYFRSISTYVTTVPERHRRTDRRTDDILWRNRALRSIAREKPHQLLCSTYEDEIWRQSFLCGRASRVEQFASDSSLRGQFTLF